MPQRTHFILNGTRAQTIAAYAPYRACFKRHGIPVAANADGKSVFIGVDPRLGAKVAKACVGFLPLPPVQQDPNNPQAVDFNRAVVACLRSRGVKYVGVQTEDGQLVIAAGGPNNDQESISLTGRYLTSCDEQASKKVHVTGS